MHETRGEVTTEETFDVLSEFLSRLLTTAEVDAIDGLATSDISFAHFRTLMVLAGRARALSLNELAEILHLSVAATGRNVDKLVGMGLVDRREDPTDRRVKRVSLTDEGHHKVTEHLDRKEDEFRNFLDRLPAALRDDLHQVLHSIVTGDYLADPDPVFAHRRQKATR
ncbi:MAG: MarR family transcriptional regulator [Gordonia paraffinivorans]